MSVQPRWRVMMLLGTVAGALLLGRATAGADDPDAGPPCPERTAGNLLRENRRQTAGVFRMDGGHDCPGAATDDLPSSAAGAGVRQDDSSISNYEIVRATFSAHGRTAIGTATCSPGKLVLGGGGRPLDEDATSYLLRASEPAGPSAWSVGFIRPENSPLPSDDQPIGEGQDVHFEVSAVCAQIR
jgi:hypothetical protein